MRRRPLGRRGALVTAAMTATLLLSPPSPPAWAKALRAVVENVAFAALPAGARAGDTIEWENKDIVAHTATARDDSFDLELPPGKTTRLVLRRAGRFAIYCRYHPNMTGELTVAP